MAQGAARCELCRLERYTRWYAEFHHPFPFVILDCDSCDVPMAVLRGGPVCLNNLARSDKWIPCGFRLPRAGAVG